MMRPPAALAMLLALLALLCLSGKKRGGQIKSLFFQLAIAPALLQLVQKKKRAPLLLPSITFSLPPFPRVDLPFSLAMQ